MKLGSVVERIEQEEKMINLFRETLKKLGRPLTIQDFIEANESIVLAMYTRDSIVSLFRKLTGQGLFSLVHSKQQPTSLLLPKQAFILGNMLEDIPARDWVTQIEKERLRNTFLLIHPSFDSREVLQRAVPFIGSFETKEANTAFLASLFHAIFVLTNTPMTTTDIAAFLVDKKENPDTYAIVLESLRAAKSVGTFENVLLKSEKKKMPQMLMVPKDISFIPLQERHWLFEDEWEQTVRKEIEKQEKVKRASFRNERFVYDELLKQKEYGVYLFFKIHRLTGFQKNELVRVKVSDYLAAEQTLIVTLKGEHGLFTRNLLLDEVTAHIMDLWLAERSHYPTHLSPYLFITKRLGQLKTPVAYVDKFRKCARQHKYTLSINYRDHLNSLERKEHYLRRHTALSLAKQHEKIKPDWFGKIENKLLVNHV